MIGNAVVLGRPQSFHSQAHYNCYYEALHPVMHRKVSVKKPKVLLPPKSDPKPQDERRTARAASGPRWRGYAELGFTLWGQFGRLTLKPVNGFSKQKQNKSPISDFDQGWESLSLEL